jgi:molybdate transport system ATP-binding protein
VLTVDLGLALGDLDLELALSVGDGEVVALLGPNGAGKTTALRAVAGLQPIDRGSIVLDGRVLDDPATGALVPPHERPIGIVFQDYLLFAHLSALENVAFGLRSRGVPRAEARRHAAGWLARVGLADRAGDRPRALSGGQAQRVALARALAIEPRLLLLDEPLAALDARTRGQVRTDLSRHLRTFAGARLLITHDPVDAIVLADRLVVLEHGRVTQEGTVAEVTARPRSPYVADLVGVNLLSGTAAGDRTVALDGGLQLTVADPLPGADVLLAVRPQALALHRHRPEGSPRNAWAATVAGVEAGPDRARVLVDGPVPIVAEVTPGAVAELGLAPGTPVWLSVKAVDVTAYER